jgi:hypothetical protein
MADPTLAGNNQTIISNQIVDTITKALTGTTLSNIQSNKSESTNSNTSDQEGGGVGSVVSSLFSGLSKLVSSAMLGPIIIIGIIILILGILAYVFRGTISKIAEKKADSIPLAKTAFGKFLFGRKRR